MQAYTWGKRTRQIDCVISKFVRNKNVFDLGAGSGELSMALLNEFNANLVYAVDCKETYIKDVSDRLIVIQDEFKNIFDLVKSSDIAFVSWPVNYRNGLPSLIREFNTVIYLGSNVGCNSCGTVNLFQHFLTRKILAHIPFKRNSLTVYGALQKEKRFKKTGEEIAGLNPEIYYTFSRAEKNSQIPKLMPTL